MPFQPENTFDFGRELGQLKGVRFTRPAGVWGRIITIIMEDCLAVAAADKRGLKRICMSCGNRFYDMNKRPVACPACQAVFSGEMKVKSRRPRTVVSDDDGQVAKATGAKAAAAAEEEEDEAVEADDDTVSLDEVEDDEDAGDEEDEDLDADLELDEELEEIEDLDEDDLDDEDDEDDEDEDEDEEDDE